MDLRGGACGTLVVIVASSGAPMRVWAEKHGIDMIIVRTEGCAVKDQATAQEWYDKVCLALRSALRGRKVYVLADLKNVTIAPEAAKIYGPLAKKVHDEFALAIVRFGSPTGMTKAAVLMQSIVNHYAANVFADLETAEGVVRQLQAAAKTGS